MSETKAHVGAIGFELFIETGLDLSSASAILFKFRKPSGATGQFTAVAATKPAPRSNTRYGAKYITASASDFDQAGAWEFQVVATLPSGYNGPGQVATLEVGEAL